MPAKPLYVLDANVIVSAVLLPGSVTRKAFDKAAACIISGDQDLLVLSPFRGIPVLTPRKFLDQ